MPQLKPNMLNTIYVISNIEITTWVFVLLVIHLFKKSHLSMRLKAWVQSLYKTFFKL
jgi:hypothetical protein